MRDVRQQCCPIARFYDTPPKYCCRTRDFPENLPRHLCLILRQFRTQRISGIPLFQLSEHPVFLGRPADYPLIINGKQGISSLGQ